MTKGQKAYKILTTLVTRRDGRQVAVQHRAGVPQAVVAEAGELPNLQPEVAAERAEYGATMTDHECLELCNTVAWDERADTWGLNEKTGGHFATRYDGQPCATDILHHKATDILVDCLAAAGEASTPTWIVLGKNSEPPNTGRPWVAPIVPAEGASGIACALGVSFFPALALRTVDRGRYDATLAWFRDELRPVYARVFWWLDDPPWQIVGTCNMGDGERQAALAAVITDLKRKSACLTQVTVFGSAVRDAGRRRQLVDQCAVVLRDHVADLHLVDLVNEPGPIGFASDARNPYAEVREVTRWLCEWHLPLRALSPASPNLLHMGVDGREATDAEIAADVEALMAGLPASVNAITPHWGRNPWHPHRPLGPYAAGKLIINDEPRGIESSVSWIHAPADFAGDLLASETAGDDSLCLHGEPGVWHGYCDTSSNASWAHNNSLPTWQSVENIDAIIAALDEVRQTGAYTGDGSDGTTPEEPPMKPRDQFYAEFQDVNAFYVAELGLQRPGGMVIDWEGDPHRADVQAMGAWGYDLLTGRTPEQIKHDICQSGEWKDKHPGEVPPF